MTWLIFAAIFLINVALNWPLFLPGDSPYRDTIEAGYQGMSRFIAAHPNPWGWNPSQYCGLPVQFTYLPLLHYGAALISAVSGIGAGYAFKLETAALACLGPSMLFLFVSYFTNSRFWGAAAALAITFCSPLYGLIRQMDLDRGIVYLPWRMHVFAKYGEGPHVAALTLVLPALVAAWTAAAGRRYWSIPAAAALFAAVCLTNWVGALALAVAVAVLMLAAYRSEAQFSYTRLIAAAFLGWGLACFWLTPSFVRTVAFNWPADSFNYKLEATQNWLIAGWFAGLILLRAAAWALRWPFYPVFVSLGVWAFGYPVLIFYSFGMDTLPESRRYALEFSLFLFLAIFEFLRFAWTSPNRVRQACAAVVSVVLLAAGLPQAMRYVTQGYSRWMPVPFESTPEYRTAQFIANQKPVGRVLASGGLRFRLNSWFDIHQVGGAFESGVRNREPLHFAYQIRTGLGSRPDQETADAILQMKALGVEYVVVHGPESDEHYRDYRTPTKFDGALDKVHGDRHSWIYRAPFRGMAHLVRPEEQPSAAHRDGLGSYVAALDDASRPSLTFRWDGPSAIEVKGPVPAGHEVVLAVSHESGWEARQDGSPVELYPNRIGFLTAKARASSGSVIRFEYRGTPEQRAMAVLSLFVWGFTVRYLWRSRTRLRGYHEERWQEPSRMRTSV